MTRHSMPVPSKKDDQHRPRHPLGPAADFSTAGPSDVTHWVAQAGSHARQRDGPPLGGDCWVEVLGRE
jgi:hypothetical protein